MLNGPVVDSVGQTVCNLSVHEPLSLPGIKIVSQIAPASDENLEPDPLFVTSRKEAGWILLMWVTCFAWTLTVCLNNGYPQSCGTRKRFQRSLEIPAWVAWGIGFPWLIADVVTIWFCLTQMEDADLGSDSEAATGTADLNDAVESQGGANV